MNKVTRMSIDLAKNVFQICGVDAQHRVVFNRAVKRAQVLKAILAYPGCPIALEACGSAHHWARLFQSHGFSVTLIPPQYVKAYVKRNKSDAHDAVAIGEAALRQDILPVPVKTVTQQEILLLHRIRERHVKARTALANQIRGYLAEFGIVIPKNIHRLRRHLPLILEDAENGLTATLRAHFDQLRTELADLDTQVKQDDQAILRWAKACDDCQRLMQLRGIGPITATALVGEVGSARPFRHGRHLAAWIGLTPRLVESGGKRQLHGISKRGNQRLRRLLVQGAHSLLNTAPKYDDAFSRWITQLKTRKGTTKTLVAIANKQARFIWVTLRTQQPIQYLAH